MGELLRHHPDTPAVACRSGGQLAQVQLFHE
jgi:hypothetical protein